ERAGELSHAALIEPARRSLRVLAKAPSQDAQRTKRSDFWGETATPPRIAPWGLLFTDPRRRLATREKWLRRPRALRTLSVNGTGQVRRLELSCVVARRATPRTSSGRAGTASRTRADPIRPRLPPSRALGARSTGASCPETRWTDAAKEASAVCPPPELRRRIPDGSAKGATTAPTLARGAPREQSRRARGEAGRNS